MSIVHRDYWGFDHKVIKDYLKTNCQYLGDFTVFGRGAPYSIWYVTRPDKKKGHKHYVAFYVYDQHGVISGWDSADMKEYLKHPAVKCKKCKDVIYSMYRHDYHSCSCGNVAVDGGRDYLKISGRPEDYRTGLLDFKKQKFKSGRVK